jgi:hypothetical protein
MRNLLRTAISSVAYLRDLFEEDCFADKEINGNVDSTIYHHFQNLSNLLSLHIGITIKALLPKTPESKLLISWFEKG